MVVIVSTVSYFPSGLHGSVLIAEVRCACWRNYCQQAVKGCFTDLWNFMRKIFELFLDNF